MNDSFAQQYRADAFAIDRFAAGDAQCRQRDVEREPRGMPPRAAARASAPRRWLEMERDGDASASMRKG